MTPLSFVKRKKKKKNGARSGEQIGLLERGKVNLRRELSDAQATVGVLSW